MLRVPEMRIRKVAVEKIPATAAIGLGEIAGHPVVFSRAATGRLMHSTPQAYHVTPLTTAERIIAERAPRITLPPRERISWKQWGKALAKGAKIGFSAAALALLLQQAPLKQLPKQPEPLPKPRPPAAAAIAPAAAPAPVAASALPKAMPAPATAAIVPPEGKESAIERILRVKAQKPAVIQLIKKVEVPEPFSGNAIHAIVKIESDYDPFTFSSAGAAGLGGLKPATFEYMRDMGYLPRTAMNIFDPEHNLAGVKAYLEYLRDYLFQPNPQDPRARKNFLKHKLKWFKRLPPESKELELIKAYAIGPEAYYRISDPAGYAVVHGKILKTDVKKSPQKQAVSKPVLDPHFLSYVKAKKAEAGLYVNRYRKNIRLIASGKV